MNIATYYVIRNEYDKPITTEKNKKRGAAILLRKKWKKGGNPLSGVNLYKLSIVKLIIGS
jgi:hypothetical protein